jgi:hypothetical protein
VIPVRLALATTGSPVLGLEARTRLAVLATIGKFGGHVRTGASQPAEGRNSERKPNLGPITRGTRRFAECVFMEADVYTC